MEGQNLDVSGESKIQNDPIKEGLTSENLTDEALETKESMDLSDKITEENLIESEESKDSGEEKVSIGNEIINPKEISETINLDAECKTEETKVIDATAGEKEIDEESQKISQETVEESITKEVGEENKQFSNADEGKLANLSSVNNQTQIISTEEFIIEEKSPIDPLVISKEVENIYRIEESLQPLLFTAEVSEETKFTVSSRCIQEPLFFNSLWLEPLRSAQYCRIEPSIYEIIDETSITTEPKIISHPLFYEKSTEWTIETIKLPKTPFLFCEIIRECNFSPKSKEIIQPLSLEILKEANYESKLKEKSYPIFIERNNEYQNQIKSKERVFPLFYEKISENTVEIKPKIINQPLIYEKVIEISMNLLDKNMTLPIFLEKNKEFEIEVNLKRNIQPLFYEKHNECSIKIEAKTNIEPIVIEKVEINRAEQVIGNEEECPISVENAIISQEENHTQEVFESDTRTQNIFQTNEASVQEESRDFEPNKEPEPSKESTPKYDKPPEPGFYDLDISGAGHSKNTDAALSYSPKLQEKSSEIPPQNPQIDKNIYEETETVEDIESSPKVNHHKQLKVKSKKPPPKIMFTDSVGDNVNPAPKSDEKSQNQKQHIEEKKEVVAIQQSPEVITDMNKIKPHQPIVQKQAKPEIRSNAGCGKCIIS